MCEALSWDYGALWNVDSGRGVLRCVETWHLPSGVRSRIRSRQPRHGLHRGVGLPGRVWASGEPAWIPDVVDDANFPRAAIARREGLHGAFCAADSRAAAGRRRHGVLQP